MKTGKFFFGLFSFIVSSLLLLGFSQTSAINYEQDFTSFYSQTTSATVGSFFIKTFVPENFYLEEIQFSDINLSGNLLLYSGNDFQTGFLLTSGIVDFNQYFFSENNSYSFWIVLDTPTVSLRSVIFDEVYKNYNIPFNFCISTYSSSTTYSYSGHLTSLNCSLMIFYIKKIIWFDDNISSLNIYYNETSFESTGDIYLTGANYIRDGQTFSYDSSGTINGVNIHWRSALNGGTWTDYYQLTDLYLEGSYDKFYTGGTENYWLLNPRIVYDGSTTFTGYSVSGWTDLEFTEDQNFSGNVFESFYTQIQRLVVSNYPLMFSILFGILLVLLLVRVLFPRKTF